MEHTAFSTELESAAIRAGQESQLKALQGYWHTQLEPGLKQAKNPDTVARDVAGFVSRIDTRSPLSIKPPNYASTGL